MHVHKKSFCINDSYLNAFSNYIFMMKINVYLRENCTTALGMKYAFT